MGLLADRIKANAARAAAGASAPPSQPSGSAPPPAPAPAPPPADEQPTQARPGGKTSLTELVRRAQAASAAPRATPAPLPSAAQPPPPASGASPSALPSWDPKYRVGAAEGIMAQRRAASATAGDGAARSPPSSDPSAAEMEAARARILALAASKAGRPVSRPAAAAAPPPAAGSGPRRGGGAAAAGRKARPAPGAKAPGVAATKKGRKRARRGQEEEEEEAAVLSSEDESDEGPEDLSDEEEAEEADEEESPAPRKRKAPARLPALWDLVAESEAEAAAEAAAVAAAAAAADPGEFRVVLDDAGRDCPPGGDAWLSLAVPGSIAQYLRPYQRAGVRFLLGAYAAGRGALLADDMGLGKTLQSVAFLAAIMGKTGSYAGDARVPALEAVAPVAPPAGPGAGAAVAADDAYAPDYARPFPCLVVAPRTLLDNWAEEFKRWGTFRVRKIPSNGVAEGVAAALAGRLEVALVSYATLGGHADALAAVPWHVAIFDEAHTLKNPKTRWTAGADRLPTPLRFALTGTPMPNDHTELFHLLNLVAPGRLGGAGEFAARYATPIKKGQKAGASADQIADGAAAQDALRAALRPLMLRRTKAIIAAQLPKKTDHVVLCRLAPVQLRVYRRLLALPDVSALLLKAKDPCPCGSRVERFKCYGDDCPGYWRLSYDQGAVLYPHFHDCDCGDEWHPVANPGGCRNHRPEGCWRRGARVCPYCLIMPLITLLRKAALHLDLLKARPADEAAAPRRFAWDAEVAAAAFGADADALGGTVQSDRYSELADVSGCGKLQALKTLLRRWAGDARGAGGRPHKVLVFSTSVRMLKIVGTMATSEGWDHVSLTGATPPDDRQALVAAFNAGDAFLCLASSAVGGVGLNLTGANKVVILDPSYSPAQDLQAMDRAFRIGQRRDVAVYRLVAAGTVEETVYLRQVSKQQHAAIAVEGEGDLRRLFKGVKGDALDKGELWGFEALLGPLLSAEAQRAAAMEPAEGEAGGSGGGGGGGAPGELDVREMAPEAVAAMEAAAAAAPPGGGGAPAEDVEDGFDAGLAALLGGGGGGGGGGDGGFGAEVLGLPGVAGVLRHDAAMAPSGRAAAERSRAVAARAAQAAVAPAGALESLAAWAGEAPVALAARLLGMTPAEREEMRRAYAAAAPRGPLRA